MQYAKLCQKIMLPQQQLHCVSSYEKHLRTPGTFAPVDVIYYIVRICEVFPFSISLNTFD